MRRSMVSLFLLLFALSVILPIVWMVVTSLKSGPEIFASPWALPHTLRWDNFGRAWNEAGIARYFLNSLLVTGATMVILLICGSMAAYIFALYPFRGSRLLFTTFTAGMMFPLFLTIVPLFFLLQRLHLLDTRIGLTLIYVAYSLPFTVFVMTGFFQSLPRELLDAAFIDGCSHAGAFWRVMLPLARPGLLVVAIFNAIGLWNEYPLALVTMVSEDLRTLPLGIANLVMVEHYQSDWGALFAALVIVMLPVMVGYWIFREHIHRTMIAGALKG